MVGVVERKSTTPGVVRFELNRSLSGMGHERFGSVVDAIGSKPSASLARQLFATGKVDSVHVYSNIVTVDVAKGYDSSGLAEIVRDVPVLEAGRRTTGLRGRARRGGGRRASGDAGGEGGGAQPSAWKSWCPPTCSSAAGQPWHAGTPPTPKPRLAHRTCSVVWRGGSAASLASHLPAVTTVPSLVPARDRCLPVDEVFASLLPDAGLERAGPSDAAGCGVVAGAG